MPRRKQYSRKGQATIFGNIEGLDKLVNKPSVIDVDGRRVINLVIGINDMKVPGYEDTAVNIARQLQPEVKSDMKPPWLDSTWQAKQRKERAGVR